MLRYSSSSIPQTEQGFTIIELLIALAMSGIILGAVCSFLIVQRQTHAAQEQITQMVQRARAAMDLMGYELQMAGYNPRRVAFEAISYHASQLQLRADLNGNGTTTEAEETITYSYDATNRRLLRDAGAGAEPLTDHIQAFTWEYLDASGTPTTTVGEYPSNPPRHHDQNRQAGSPVPVERRLPDLHPNVRDHAAQSRLLVR